MPEDIPGTPEPDVPAPSTPGTDEAVAQNYFDTEVSRINSRLDEMQQAMTHMLNSMEMGNNHAGHSASQSQAGAPASQGEPHAAVSAQAGVGRQSLSAETEGELEPERSPAPSHWYWRSVLGGR